MKKKKKTSKSGFTAAMNRGKGYLDFASGTKMTIYDQMYYGITFTFPFFFIAVFVRSVFNGFVSVYRCNKILIFKGWPCKPTV